MLYFFLNLLFIIFTLPALCLHPWMLSFFRLCWDRFSPRRHWRRRDWRIPRLRGCGFFDNRCFFAFVLFECEAPLPIHFSFRNLPFRNWFSINVDDFTFLSSNVDISSNHDLFRDAPKFVRGIANCCPNLTVWCCRLFGQPLLEHSMSMFKFYIQVEMHAAMLARTAIILGCPAEGQS